MFIHVPNELTDQLWQLKGFSSQHEIPSTLRVALEVVEPMRDTTWSFLGSFCGGGGPFLSSGMTTCFAPGVSPAARTDTD